jgi:hypothetical protein
VKLPCSSTGSPSTSPTPTRRKATIKPPSSQPATKQRSKVAGLETHVATLTTDKATLEQKLKDSTPSAQQLRDAARAYGVTLAKAKALGVSINDTMDAAAIMKATVSAKLGDTAKDWNDVQVAASFAALTIDTKVDDAADPLRDAIRDQPLVIADASAVRNLARSMQY